MSSFQDFKLAEPLLQAVADVGYEAPSPIQAASIPPLLEGRDLVGQAQTGTGKTAAFALPLLSRLDSNLNAPQILVLAPTRELAIQVAEAFQTYARHIKNFRILPVYGGQGMDTQLRGLKRGVQVIVGTPGRVIDHLKRKTLKLNSLQALVLDEADEMLKMGFIDDVEWILEQSPESRQVALFSATLPERIRNIARKHLNEPVEIKIKSKTSTVDTITQRYWAVGGVHKLDALTRILEVEDFDGMIIFVRTKNATVELAEKLEARGFSASALNGDMNQNLREKTIDRLKKSTLDILVATDVAARGLDVERISHVVNYDIPYDTEAYIHRVGRTGRAGRKGVAILFVAPRETRMLRTIERATKQPITQMQLPTRKDIAERRIAQFKEQLDQVLVGSEDLSYYSEVIQEYLREVNAAMSKPAVAETGDTDEAADPDADVASDGDAITKTAGAPALTLERIAGALTYLVQQERPFHAKKPESRKSESRGKNESKDRPDRSERIRSERPDRSGYSERPARPERPERSDRAERKPAARSMDRDSGADSRPAAPHRPRSSDNDAEFDMARFRVAVGKMHGAEPKHIVGAIANEAGLDSKYIGEIKLYDDYSTVDLPDGIPKEIMSVLKKARVMGQKLELRPEGEGGLPAVPKRAAGSATRAAGPDKPARSTEKPRTKSSERSAPPPAGRYPKDKTKKPRTAKSKSGVGIRAITKAAPKKKIRLKKKSAAKKSV